MDSMPEYKKGGKNLDSTGDLKKIPETQKFLSLSIEEQRPIMSKYNSLTIKS